MKRLTIKLGALLLLVTGLAACAADDDVEPTPEAAQRFLKLRGYDFDQQNFFKAAAAGDAIAVGGFISGGMNIESKNADGDTVLTASAAQGNAKIVSLLLKRGADVNAKGRNNWTAFLLALKGEQRDVADALLAEPKLDLKAETPEGQEALMLAVWHDRPEVVRTLLQRGSDINHQDKDGDTALHGAAGHGSVQILQMLLDAGANPNIKNKLGGTALMWAASFGEGESVQLLLRKGADPRIKDVDGVTAAGWAAKNGKGNLVMMLKAAEKGQ
jgi:hypothetical protein